MDLNVFDGFKYIYTLITLIEIPIALLWLWELLWLLSPADMTLVVFYTFPVVWNDKILQAHLVYLLPQTYNWPFLQEALI